MNHLRLLTTVLSVVLLPCYVAGQQEKGQPQNGLGVEITSSRGTKVTLYVSAANPTPENLFGIIPVPNDEVARSQAGETISGFKFVPRIEKNALRIAVLALFDNREHLIASYLANKGETVSVLEVTQYRIEPFRMKIVDARTIPVPQANFTLTPLFQSFGQTFLTAAPYPQQQREEQVQWF